MCLGSVCFYACFKGVVFVEVWFLVLRGDFEGYGRFIFGVVDLGEEYREKDFRVGRCFFFGESYRRSGFFVIFGYFVCV